MDFPSLFTAAYQRIVPAEKVASAKEKLFRAMKLKHFLKGTKQVIVLLKVLYMFFYFEQCFHYSK